MKNYRKALVAVAAFVSEIVALGVLHGTAESVATAVLAGLTAFGVWRVKNDPTT